ncbi:MAG: excinuclease ABC subunit UvrA [Sumerlaeia bacterium]
MPPSHLRIYGAAEHNLKGFDVSIPRNSLTVVTGLSGSGKSSLAFDTIYAEGQRRYIESLSSYARQFLDQMPKPHVEHIEGLSPAISIEQKTVARNPRSTVGTVTEIYDYLRLCYATIGQPHCPVCDRPLDKQSAEDMTDTILALPEKTRLHILAPIVRGRKGEYQALFQQALKEGFVRAKVDGEVVELDPTMRLKRSMKHDISIMVDRVIVRRGDDALPARILEGIEKALDKADGLVILETVPDGEGAYPKGVAWEGERMFSQALACLEHGPQIVELAPRMFSFNSPYGWCEQCHGLGVVPEVDMDALVPRPELSIPEGAVEPWRKLFFDERDRPKDPMYNWTYQMLRALEKKLKFSLETPWQDLPNKVRDTLLSGLGEEKVTVKMPTRRSGTLNHSVPYRGLITRIRDQILKEDDEENREDLEEYLRNVTCPQCHGHRLKPESLAVRINGRHIGDCCNLPVSDAAVLFRDLKLTERQEYIAQQPLKEVRDRLGFLLNVGLSYLTLNRHAGTLSGGEAQRIRLATQIGSRLKGVLYILDEPSIGLHQRDNERLIATLEGLREMGNTVVVVEHDEATIRAADFVVDLGPGAGAHGGELVAVGTPADLEKAAGSLTGDYLSGKRSIPVPEERRPIDPKRSLTIRGAKLHNLKGVDADFPLGVLVGVSGVSGSGKSSLVIETLFPALMNHVYRSRRGIGDHAAIEGLEHLDKVINVDQAPIGRTPRSNPATYTKVFDAVRDLFAQTPEARMRGYAKGRFSFNAKGGRCEECGGAGLKRIEMGFLPDVYVECEVCGGKRYNRETLDILYRGKTIADVLEMTIDEGVEFFAPVPSIATKLRTIQDVGLGYITLGQQATTLSGGEAQRIKLSRELAKRNTGKTLYILDEPTTGLHFEDVRKLVEVMNKLVDAGSTVVVIEHNLDVLKCCDWLLDLGPEGGEGGGEIVAEGPPEAVAACKRSETGRFLKELLKPAAKKTADAKKPADKKTAAKKAAKPRAKG